MKLCASLILFFASFSAIAACPQPAGKVPLMEYKVSGGNSPVVAAFADNKTVYLQFKKGEALAVPFIKTANGDSFYLQWSSDDDDCMRVTASMQPFQLGRGSEVWNVTPRGVSLARGLN